MVDDGNQRAVLLDAVGEIAPALHRSGHRGTVPPAGLLDPPVLAAEKEEQLVLLDGAAEYAADRVETIRRFCGPEAVVVERVCVEHLVTLEPISRTVELVRPRLGNDIDLGAGAISPTASSRTAR